MTRGSEQLRRSVRGEDVSRLQKLLAAAGFGIGDPDGEFGDDTERAVRAFQEARGLPADGIAGPSTLAALERPEEEQETGRRRSADGDLPGRVTHQVTASSLRLRRAPSTSSGEVVHLPFGADVERLGDEVEEADGYEWAHVRAVVDGDVVDGWVAVDYLEPVSEDGGAADELDRVTHLVTASSLRLRGGPSTSSEIMADLSRGTGVERLGDEVEEAEGYEWAHVRAVVDGDVVDGWVAVDYLEPVSEDGGADGVVSEDALIEVLLFGTEADRADAQTRALTDPDLDRDALVATMLDVFDDREGASEPWQGQSWLSSTLGRLAADEPGVDEVLERQLRSPVAYVRFYTLAGLYHGRSRRIGEHAESVRDDDDPQVRFLAEAVLADRGDESAVEVLRNALGRGPDREPVLAALRTVPVPALVDDVAELGRFKKYAEQVATVVERMRTVESEEPGPVDDAAQVHDRPATEDLLDRSRLAGGLAGQLIAVHQADDGSSYAVLIAGNWGSGKTSLVNLTLEELAGRSESSTWVVPRPDGYFDAWRESQVGPAWWSLLTWLRSAVCDQQPTRWRKAVFRIVERSQQFRRSGLLFPVAFVAAVLAVVSWRGWEISAVAAVVAFAASLLAVGQTANRFLSWRSPGGALLFEQTGSDPMGDLVEHVNWIRAQVDGPIVLVIDDLDRCSADYVVALLDAVQTILRRPTSQELTDEERAGDDPRPEARRRPWWRPPRRPSQPLVVVVAADDRWLHTAFERRYGEFSRPLARVGRPLGHLFLAKLFQLQLRVPELRTEEAVHFGRLKLRMESPQGPTDAPPLTAEEASQQVEAATSFEQAVQVVDRVAEPTERRKVAAEVGRSVAAGARHAELTHELERFLPLLDPEPRAVVRFINAYAMHRMAVPRVSPAVSARWTVLELRWPAIAERLRHEPHLVEVWHRHGVDDDDPHAAAIRSSAFTEVVVDTDTDELALGAADILACVASPAPTTPDRPAGEVDHA